MSPAFIVFQTAPAWMKTPQYMLVQITAPTWGGMTNREKAAKIEESLGFMPGQWHEVKKAITVRQPWAWAILHAGKNIENRTRRMAAPGFYFLHAGKAMSADEYDTAAPFIESHSTTPVPQADNTERLRRGGIIGIFQITGWTDSSFSPWFFGIKGAEIGVSFPIDFIPCQGGQGVFFPKI